MSSGGCGTPCALSRRSTLRAASRAAHVGAAAAACGRGRGVGGRGGLDQSTIPAGPLLSSPLPSPPPCSSPPTGTPPHTTPYAPQHTDAIDVHVAPCGIVRLIDINPIADSDQPAHAAAPLSPSSAAAPPPPPPPPAVAAADNAAAHPSPVSISSSPFPSSAPPVSGASPWHAVPMLVVDGSAMALAHPAALAGAATGWAGCEQQAIDTQAAMDELIRLMQCEDDDDDDDENED